ncbi:MAG TPA: amidohydrolase family protein [Lysobacter sp.]|nr:amidohydrolase family protein [Lysobacter sp.]
MSYQRILTAILVSMALLACDAKQREATATTASVAEPATAPASAPATETPAPTTLFRNVRIFNGVDPDLKDATDVLVRGNRIAQIGKTDLPAEPGLTIIDGGGRTLMPGLIDHHWHTLAARPSLAVALTSTSGYLNLMAAAEASDTLQRGFTTVRDVGGASFGLKRAIDEGWQAGPRIYPSGAIISVTGGHGDFRSPDELPRALGTAEARQEVMGDTAIADTPDEVRVRVREQLMRGASQIKMTAGGGVSSPHSPLDVVAFTPDELRAAVVAANQWGTYVTAHAFTPAAIKQSVEAGVQCIEHGFLMDEATAQLMASRGTWLSI